MLQKSNQTKVCLSLSKNKQTTNWDNLFPNKGFGWSGSHLSDTERVHFFLVEKFIKNHPKIFQDGLQSKTISHSINVLGTQAIPDLFILKFNHTKNELIFGQVVGNFLRSHDLPNIAYCFGLLNDQSLIVEYQRNSVTMNQFLASPDYNFLDFLLILIQLMNVEFYLYQIVEFSHNDFHLDNIIIRFTPNHKRFKIPLLSLKSNKTILCEKVPVIIDMGLATFRINEELEFPNKSKFLSILSDIYFMLQRVDSLVTDEHTKTFLKSLDGFNQFLLKSILSSTSNKPENLSFLNDDKVTSSLFNEDDARVILNQPENIKIIFQSLINFVWLQIPNELKNEEDAICPHFPDFNEDKQPIKKRKLQS